MFGGFASKALEPTMLMIVHQLNYIGACSALFYGIRHGGLGKHVVDVPRDVLWLGIKV